MEKNNPSLKDLIFYFIKLGSIGFGGSIALANSMHNDLVKKEHWINEKEYLRGLTLSQLAPGPLSAQLAIYIGFVARGILGATIAGIAFILPSFILVIVISIFYLRYGTIPAIQTSLYGIGASVVGIIAISSYELTSKTMKRKFLLWIIFIITFILTAFFRQTSAFIFIFAGLITMLIYKHEKIEFPTKMLNVVLNPFSINIPALLTLPPVAKLFIFFIQAGALAFGGGLAIVPFLHSGVVSQNHWLTNKQFIDAVAVAMVTPGPVVIAATFIGYLVAQIPGAVVATVAIFLPVYLIVILLAPIFEKHSENHNMISFIEGVTAAAMGAIAGSIILLGTETINDFTKSAIAISSFIFIKFFRIPTVIVIICAGILGVLLYR